MTNLLAKAFNIKRKKETTGLRPKKITFFNPKTANLEQLKEFCEQQILEEKKLREELRQTTAEKTGKFIICFLLSLRPYC